MPVPTLGMLALCRAASMGIGGLNEVIEFFLTLTLPETNIGGYINTGWDLVSNLAGVVVACCLIGWNRRSVSHDRLSVASSNRRTASAFSSLLSGSRSIIIPCRVGRSGRSFFEPHSGSFGQSFGHQNRGVT